MSLLLQNPKTEFADDAVRGLSANRKTLPCKYFYDERGSRLFDQICDLPEYYPTRTESAIMCQFGPQIAQNLGEAVAVIEYGSGSSLKTRILLEQLQNPALYVPIDISREHLWKSAQSLSEEFPDLEIAPVAADYTKPFDLPETEGATRAIYFPGSTIGNFAPREAEEFLSGIAEVAGPNGALLIGVDLEKSVAVLELAYNDAAGVTAEFNLNLLWRINRELGANFDLKNWEHYAVWNGAAHRIEMHLLSLCDQRVAMGEHLFCFGAGETILTEYSHKWTLRAFERLANRAGFEVEEVWTDENQWFSVQLLRAV